MTIPICGGWSERSAEAVIQSTSDAPRGVEEKRAVK